MKSIIRDHIMTGSKKEINISSNLKDEIQTRFEGLQNDTSPDVDAFHEFLGLVTQIVNREIRADNFPRFIRSKQFQQAATSFYNNSKIMIPRVTVDFPFTERDFSVTHFTKRDLAFAQWLTEDNNDWKLVYNRSGSNGYIRFLGLFPRVSFLQECTIMKHETIIPYTLDVCVLANSNYNYAELANKQVKRMYADKYFKAQDMKDSLKNDVEVLQVDTALTLIYAEIGLVFDVRRTVALTTIVKRDDKIYIIYKPCQVEGDPKFLERAPFSYEKENKKIECKAYQTPCWQVIMLSKIDENKTLHSEVTIARGGGWLDGAVTNLVKNLIIKGILEKVVEDLDIRYKMLTTTTIDPKSKMDLVKIEAKTSAQAKLMSRALFPDHVVDTD
jgi:hypothetical protein